MLIQNFDILLYAPYHSENVSESDLQWIRNFQSILEISVQQVLKQNIKISNSIFEQEGNSKVDFDKFKVIIQFLFNNDFIQEECVQNLKFRDKSSLFQVVCKSNISTPNIENDRNLKSYKFYIESSKKDNSLFEIGSIKNEVWLKILDITYEIGKSLKGNEKVDQKKLDQIFVAETSDDQRNNRNTLVREFQHLGFKVVPEDSLSNNMMEFSESVNEAMENSIISIHIIGNNYAPLIENIEISKVELQNDIFSEVVALKPNLKRFVWIPPNLKPKSEKQKQYIESFKRNIELLKNTEIIQTPIETFKSIINKNLDFKDSKPEIIQDSVSGDKKIAYIIHNNDGQKRANEIAIALRKLNIDTIETKINGNKIELIQQHKQNMINSDMLIIVYSSENEQWLNSKLSDIIKSPGFGKKNSFSFKAVLVDTEKKPIVKFKLKDLHFIDAKDKNASDCLIPILDKI